MPTNHGSGVVDSVLTRRHLLFAGFLVLSILVFWKTLAALLVYSLEHESASHILLVPFVVLYLFYSEGKSIFQEINSSLSLGSAILILGIICFLISHRYLSEADGNGFLILATLSVVLIWAGGFVCFYGIKAARVAAFPLLFLILLVPMPDLVQAKTIHFLQQGSTAVSEALFKISGVPVLRQGFILSVPGATIEVAEECSGIRSSMAMFITCLIAGHLFLRTRWRILLFVALALPLAIIKNGIRITTLTLLSIYVDRGFLTGRFHHEGGFAFYLLALAIQLPILLYLRKREKKVKTALSAA